MRTLQASPGPRAAAGTMARWFAVVFATLLIGGCASVRYDVPRQPSFAFANPQESELGRRFANQLSSSPGMSGFRLLASGQEAFIARAALAEAAQRSHTASATAASVPGAASVSRPSRRPVD